MGSTFCLLLFIVIVISLVHTYFICIQSNKWDWTNYIIRWTQQTDKSKIYPFDIFKLFLFNLLFTTLMFHNYLDIYVFHCDFISVLSGIISNVKYLFKINSYLPSSL